MAAQHQHETGTEPALVPAAPVTGQTCSLAVDIGKVAF